MYASGFFCTEKGKRRNFESKCFWLCVASLQKGYASRTARLPLFFLLFVGHPHSIYAQTHSLNFKIILFHPINLLSYKKWRTAAGNDSFIRSTAVRASVRVIISTAFDEIKNLCNVRHN